jgi:hypothetical protein
VLGRFDPVRQHLPFGGAVLVGASDFRQVLPIVVHGSRGDTVRACLKHSGVWRDMRVLRLTDNLRALLLERQGADATQLRQWADFLLRIGNGTQPTDARGDVQLPDYLRCSDNTLDGLIDTIYGRLSTLAPGSAEYTEYLTSRAILAPRNVQAPRHAVQHVLQRGPRGARHGAPVPCGVPQPHAAVWPAAAPPGPQGFRV